MKTAPAFLVAVTVFTSLFLESSTAPNPMLGALSSTVDDLGKIGGDVVKHATNTVGDVGILVTELGEGVVAKFVADIEAVSQAIGNIVKDLTGLLGGLLGTVGDIKGELGEKLKKALADAKTTLKEVIELSKNIVKTAAESANNTVKEDGLLKKAVKKLYAHLALVTDIIKEISEEAGDNAPVVVKVKLVLAEVIEGVENLLSNVDKAVKSKTTKVVDDSDQLRLKERITSSNKALEECIETVRNAMDKATGEYKDGTTEVYKWLTKEFQPLVAKTHSKLEQVAQGTGEQRNAMASELIKICEQVEVEVSSFTNIPEIVKTVLKEKVMIVIMGNARGVAKKLPQA